MAYHKYLLNKDLVYREFGLLLAAERRRKRLSQSQLAELVDLSRTSITNIECGRQPIQLHQLFSFASILRTDVRNLLPKELAFTPEQLPGASQAAARHVDNVKSRYIEDVKRIMEKLVPPSPGDRNG